MAARKLARSRDEKMVGGVAAGIAHYVDLDPTLVRLLWVVAVLLPGPGFLVVLAYLVLWVVLPLDTMPR